MPSKKSFAYFLAIAIPTQVLLVLAGLDLAEILGLDGVLVALAAVAVAIKHVNGLDVVAEELRSVARSVPTRGIGVFPEYMSEVANLVGRAENSIKILCDTPAHGAFSNTADFEKYWQNLRYKMIDKVEIHGAFFNATGREQLHEAQIAMDEDNWKEWKNRNSDNCTAFDQFARGEGLEPKSPTSNQDPVEAWASTPRAYVESMMSINKAVLSNFPKGISPEKLRYKKPLHEGPSVYFWLRDGNQEAVFVIVPVRGIGVQYLAGFHTEEQELIRALSAVYSHRKEGG